MRKARRDALKKEGSMEKPKKKIGKEIWENGKTGRPRKKERVDSSAPALDLEV